MKRVLAVLSVPFLALAMIVSVSSPASAHEVTGISATCHHVVVSFADFPDTAVSVHIAVTVEGHGSTSADVMVSGTMTTSVDIASLTAGIFGTGTVDVDATWNFQGSQHFHGSTGFECCGCNTTTTTTAPAATTTTVTAPASTTTTSVVVGGVTTTTAPHGTNSTSTTIAGIGVTGNTTTTTASSAGPSVAVLGNSETAPVSGSSSGSSLPFTGSTALPLAGLGLGLIAAGTALAVRRRS